MQPLKQAEAEDDLAALHSARTEDERLLRAEDEHGDTLRTAGDEHQPRATDEPAEAADKPPQEAEDETAIDAIDAIDNRQIKK